MEVLDHDGRRLILVKEILFVSFDSEMARSLGVVHRFWDFCFYVSLGAVIALATKSAGVLMTFGYLVVPPVTALLMCKKMRTTFAVSVLFSLLATVIGLFLQHLWETPPGQTIVAVAVALLLLVVVWRWNRLSCLFTGAVVVAVIFIGRPVAVPQEQACKACLIIVQAESSRSPATKAEVMVSFTNDSKQNLAGEPLSVVIAAQNLGDERRQFFMQLDLGIGEPVVYAFDLPPRARSEQPWSIPSSVSKTWQGTYTVVPTFWADRDGIVPLSFVVACQPLRVELIPK